ncbi:substrate-binding domain-containing protein [Streptomyces sp. CRN 30]|uniref:substrate-binding domain-containing protein n=1 Tax=Streptomyces sp. CRN 30 TaxID=3075613 RepID=UPI002A8003C6|nr:substrate-binding domain-containing protein [Streptomyces sp. CRN 30]
MAANPRDPHGGAEGGPRRPLTVGLLTANIHLGVGATLWSGVRAAAERNDVGLVCFPGGEVRDGGVPRGALYELVGPARLDGVVCWSSTIGLPSSGTRARRLLRGLAHLPVISLNQPLGEEADVLSVDSHAGMRKLVGHLVARHGCRRPACIRGPVANPVSEDRYRAYVDALRHHGIGLESTHVCAAVDFGAAGGASAMRVLLEARGLKPGVDFDAVLACSDVLAADALRLLTERGVRVPEDVAVVGFNDSPEARLGDPPLTSVALPFAELGALAVDTLVARLRGTRPPDRTTIPATLVPRRSCGCPYPASRDIVAPAPGAARAPQGWAALDAVLPSAGTRLAEAFRADLAPDGPPPGGGPAATSDAEDDHADRAEKGHAYGADVSGTAGARTRATGGAEQTGTGRTRKGTAAAAGTGGAGPAGGTGAGRTGHGVAGGDEVSPAGGFLALFEQLLRGRARSQGEVDRWYQALERARPVVVAGLPADRRGHAEALFGRAGLLVAERARGLLEYGRWTQAQRARRLREFGTALTTVVDLDGLSDVLERHLAQPGVPGCRIVLYEQTAPGAAVPVRGMARPLLTRAEARRLGHSGVLDSPPFPAALLLPDPLLPGGGRRSRLVLEPLHIGEQQLGLAVFDATASDEPADHDGALYRELGDQISAALKGIGLFDEVRRARDAAEQAHRFQTRLLTHVVAELRDPLEAMLARDGDDPGAVLTEVHRDAARLLHLSANLLDLAQSEAGDLVLTRRLLDPLPLLRRACAEAAAGRRVPGYPRWSVELPDRLPSVPADAARLRQILGNVLTAAADRARDATVRVSACWSPAGVRIVVAVPGAPAVVSPAGGSRRFDIGLTTARRLAMMHGGSLRPADTADGGAYVLELPLPSPDGHAHRPAADAGPLLVVAPGEAAEDVRRSAGHHRVRTHPGGPDLDAVPFPEERGPGAVVWEALPDRPQEWRAVQRLHDHPALRHTPFVLFGARGADLGDALRALRPAGLAEPVVVAGRTPRSREALRRIAEAALPDHPTRVVADAATVLALIAEETPRLVVLEDFLGDLHGLDVVERLHDGAGRALCPAVVAGHDGITAADARRARPHPALLLLDLDVFTPSEAASLVRELTGRDGRLPPRVRAVLDEALVYLYEHYRRPVSRWQVAQAAGVSEDHLGRLFHRRYGLTLWEYLTRLRVRRAAERLRSSEDSVQSVARAVGFRDRSYFSRVFRRVTGVSPHFYREGAATAGPPAGDC